MMVVRAKLAVHVQYGAPDTIEIIIGQGTNDEGIIYLDYRDAQKIADAILDCAKTIKAGKWVNPSSKV